MPAPASGRRATGQPDLAFHSGRVHLTARQRGADATAIVQLLLNLPNFLCSLATVWLVGLMLPTVLAWLLIIGWVLSGVLVFHRPTERLIARYLLNLRYPTRAELSYLAPIWREVTVRAGVEAATYDLWIEDSRDLNAYAAAGHIVGVTRYSLQQLTPGELAAVLAHELGHHTGGHAWSSLLGFWYSLPGRFMWRLLRFGAASLVTFASYFSSMGAAICALVIGCFVISAAISFPPVLLLLVTPYLLAAVGRRAELRADRRAAELGFAHTMIDLLHKQYAEAELEETERKSGGRAKRPGPVAMLLSSHPDHHTRIRRLEEYLARVR